MLSTLNSVWQAQAFRFDTSLLWFDALTGDRSKYPSLRQISSKQASQAFRRLIWPLQTLKKKCVYEVGSAAKLTVTSSELTCVSIGYVGCRVQSQFQWWRFLCDRRFPLVPLVQDLGSSSWLRKSGTIKSQWFYSWFKPDVIELVWTGLSGPLPSARQIRVFFFFF